MKWKDFAAVPYAVLDMIDPTATHVYAWCRRFADFKTGVLSLSVAEIARRASLSTDTFSRALSRLEVRGWAKLEGPNGRQRWRVIPPGAEMEMPAQERPSEQTAAAPERPSESVSSRSRAINQDLPYVERSIRSDSDGSCDPVILSSPHRSEDQNRRRETIERTRRDVERVFAVFEERSGRPGHVRDLAVMNRVRDAIHMAGIDKCVAAVKGIWMDEWWSARNPKISQALRDAETIERFASMAPGDMDMAMIVMEQWDALREEAFADPCWSEMRDAIKRYPCAVRGVCIFAGEAVPIFVDPLLTLASKDLAVSFEATKIMLTRTSGISDRERIHDAFRRVKHEYDEVLRETIRREKGARDEQAC